ncbi:hypothetical protein SAMN05421749_10251 [Acinetobacter marinus]|uniref:Uncharacterized protein n=1 Tax=Acinetobacter marinus TaxID=281375 RepID=A0A1G6HB54_9GAMM|nr:hypothetical protein [Acinetobacter marinus]SDB91512.1 hypothetical protein SAMN05421749_10251 [Acinetobacter marinus]
MKNQIRSELRELEKSIINADSHELRQKYFKEYVQKSTFAHKCRFIDGIDQPRSLDRIKKKLGSLPVVA